MNSYWGETSFGKNAPTTAGYAECIDTLGGVRYRIITYSSLEIYSTIAVDDTAYARGAWSTILAGQSPDSADLQLFLAIFRTLRIETTPDWSKYR